MTKRFWKWPSLIRSLTSEKNQLLADLNGVRQSLIEQRNNIAESEALAQRAMDGERRALTSISAQIALAQDANEKLDEATVEIQKLSETVSTLEDTLARRALETERIKAELSKTEANLARARLDEQREKDAHAKTRRTLTLTREFIHVTHRIDIPARHGVRAALMNGAKRLVVIFAFVLPMLCAAAPPPPFWHNPWSTNQTPRAVEGQDNLSVTNLGSTTNWQFFNVGPFTVARLIDITNSLAGAGDAGGTNARQFGSLNLTNWSNIPTGEMANVVATAFLTNWANSISNLSETKQNGSAVLSNLVGTVARNVTNVVSLSTTNAASKPLTNSYTSGVLELFGLEAGANITLTPNASNIVVASTASGGGGPFDITQFDASSTVTNIRSGALVTNLSSLNLTNRGNMTNAGTMTIGGTTRMETNLLALGTNDLRYLKLSGGVDRRVILRTDDSTNVVASTIGAGLSFDGTTLTTSFSGLATNANQFAANTTLTIREGALLTNTLFWQSNITGPATITTGSIGAITNLTEWRQSNGIPSVVINSNAQLSFGPENIKTAIAFRTNQIDLSTYQWKPFTNSLQTNIVLQVTNLTEGVQTTLDIYGAGIFGGTVTNAWNVLLTTSAGTTIKWPVGATNGNFDVLVNSNQVVQINLWASRRTNVLASYKAFE